MSELDDLILPEIFNDKLFGVIKELASNPLVKNILEIGSSSGEGSTRAFYEGIGDREDVQLFCLEMSKIRFNKLLENYRGDLRLKCFNMSSIHLDEFPFEEVVVDFYQTTPSVLNAFPLERVLGWLVQDKMYIRQNGVHCGGIAEIKRIYGIKLFDLVLIDGSEFTGYAEFRKIVGAKTIILDDVCSFKNFRTYLSLWNNQDYRLLCEDKTLRSGFAVFERVA